MNIEELDILRNNAQNSEIVDFAKKYFNKDVKDLTDKENHEIDCFGMYGMSEWLIDFEKGDVKSPYTSKES